MLNRGTILVTGGAGHIGSSLVLALNQRGLHNILIADILERSEKWRNLVPLRFDDYVEADELFSKLSPSVTTVLHLGGISSTTEPDAARLIKYNYEYTKRLAEWSLAHDARFVYASSAATYGALETGLSEDRDLSTLRPLNMYGYSKHLFDLYAQSHGYFDRITGLKYFNVYGPNEEHKNFATGDMRSMVLRAFEQIQATGRVKLFKSYRNEFKDGEQRRDFLYVKDAVEMTIHLAEDPTHVGLFNIASGQSHSWLDLANAVFSAMGRKPEIEFIEMPEALRGRYQYFTEADLIRLRASGYSKPTTPLAAAVQDYVVNYLSRPSGN